MLSQPCTDLGKAAQSLLVFHKGNVCLLLLDVGEAQEKQYSASCNGPRWVGKAPKG